MPNEWRKSVLVPLCKNNDDNCSNYHAIKLMSHYEPLENVNNLMLRHIEILREMDVRWMTDFFNKILRTKKTLNK